MKLGFILVTLLMTQNVLAAAIQLDCGAAIYNKKGLVVDQNRFTQLVQEGKTEKTLIRYSADILDPNTVLATSYGAGGALVLKIQFGDKVKVDREKVLLNAGYTRSIVLFLATSVTEMFTGIGSEEENLETNKDIAGRTITFSYRINKKQETLLTCSIKPRISWP